VIIPLVLGVVVMALFVYWEISWAKHPIIPIVIFKGNRAVPAALTVAMVGGMPFSRVESPSRSLKLT
jgi:hypothetical protein